MTASPQPQTAIGEQQISNDVLEQALEARQAVKERRSALNAEYKEADDRAKALAAQVEFEEGVPVRVGRFVLVKKTRPGHAVSFETETKIQLVISADE